MSTAFSAHLIGGDHASRPAANTVPDGTLYGCTDHDLIYQSDGAAWGTWFTAGQTIADILDIPTAETDDALVLAPDGAGGVEFRAEAGGGGDGPVIVRKTADEVVNNSSTLQDDNELLLPLLANEVWKFDFTLFYDSGTAPDIKIGFTYPSGATIRYGVRGADAAGADYGESFVAVDGSAKSLFASGAGTFRQAHLIGIIINGANAGNLQLQWAQNSGSATDTTVHDNSHLFAWQLV